MHILGRHLFTRFILLLLMSVLVMPAVAQKTRQQLENEKKSNQNKIKEIQGVLKQTSSKKNTNLKQLQVINSQISVQKKQIDLLNDDLKLLDKELNNLATERRKLDHELVKLKEEYSKMLYEASKRSLSYNNLVFLFSANTFNQFVLRYKYLKQYTDARKKQAHQLEGLQAQIAAQQNQIADKKNQQKVVLDSRVTEANKLSTMQTEKNKVVSELSKQEEQLKAELAETRRLANQLEQNLRKIIEREMRERAERERRERLAREAREKANRERLERERDELLREGKSTDAVDTKISESEKVDLSGMNSEEVKLASSFTASKNRLPWPVRGFVTDHFGTHAHPILKGVVIDNIGINIQTNAGEPVKVVYDGLVLDVNNMAGLGYVVAVQHGDYMTVYVKLKSVSVRPGQRIKARETIGTVKTNPEGTSELQFQIWKNTTKLNPEAWLMRR